MSRLDKNKNFIDDAKGRKWSWGNFGFIGEFTTIDFFIVSFGFLIMIPIFILIHQIWISLLINFTIFFTIVILIKEVKGNKLYELIFDYFAFLVSDKKVSVLEFIENKEVVVYEVISGFDVTNLKEEDFIAIDKHFNSFYEKVTGELKIIKTTTTYRLEESLKNLGTLVNSSKGITQEIIGSYYENLDRFSKSKMPNIYLRFDKMQEDDIKIALSELENIIELRKLSLEEWQAIIFQEFGGKIDFEVKKNYIVSQDQEVKKAITKINFGRNVPSLFLNDFIYNEYTSFVIDFKTPDYEEMNKVRKSIKKWSKNVEGSFVDEKDFIKNVNKKQEQQAKNEVLTNFLFGNNSLKFFNTYVIFTEDKNSDIKFNKEIERTSKDAQFKLNFNLSPLTYKQQKYFRNIWFERSEMKWFPTNVSTITNVLPFQNESILNPNGAYIGTSGVKSFPFMFHPFRKKGISGFHTGIVSKTGGGKSTLLKMLMAADFAIDDTKFLILDPKNEFRYTMETVGGETIDVSRRALNPLKFTPYSEEDFEYDLLDKVSEIKEFLFIVLSREAKTNGDVSEKISAMADDIKKFYEFHKKDLFNNYEFNFSDFSGWLERKNVFIYKNILLKFTEGVLSRFNKYDDINFDQKSIDFELLNVKNIKDESIRNAIMFSITSKIINQIYLNQQVQQKISFIIDEAGWFFKSEFLTSKIESIMVEARAFNTKITWATQNLTDLINDNKNNEQLISIYSNTEHMFTGQIKLPQRAALNELLTKSGGLALSKSELSWIEDSESIDDKGKFLYQRAGITKKIKVDLLNQYVIKPYFFEEHQITQEED